jgi:hypothetical protein
MRIRAREPAWLSVLLLGVVLSGTAAASAEETEPADAYASGLLAFERGDTAAALRLWTPPAEQGDPRAQFGLGLIHEEGLGGLPRDEAAALGWYERAARFGLSPAQNNLAGMHAEGRGVPRDPARAVALWRQAAAAGFGPAQLNLAFALERGVGVERNAQEAAEWYQRGTAQQRVLARSEGGEAPPLGGGRDEAPRRQRAPVASVGGETRWLPPKRSTPETPSPAATFYVQLASFPTREEAVRFGDEVSRRRSDVLGSWQPSVRTVDLGTKGVWHRVLFGPIEGRTQAAALCEQMQTRGEACLVARPAAGGPTR